MASSGSPCPMLVESQPAAIRSYSEPNMGSPIGHTTDIEPISGSMVGQPIDDVGPSSGLLDGSPATEDGTIPRLQSTDLISTQLHQHSMVARSKGGISKPNPKYALATSTVTIPNEPKSVKSALKHPSWHAAMLDEIDALNTNHTWVLVPRSPWMNIIGCKWVFKTKLQADGSVERLEARLVAKGYTQQEGLDFSETFSPVIKPSSLRIILTIATVKKWPIRQLDVKNAFLNGFLTEQVFMEQPPGFVDTARPSHVCHLKRAIYCLKQAPRA
eukprot:TRINITY_DN2221_c1_g1_i1.p1 TRINITY_DN2221_c1_g1~~TRINITY_DN2221_c1_g1_i1.p1  ORF type:complete len:272 (+),score=34.04 TRINITY_DN2221_c1_g1_i1:2153-2968(+)